MIPSLTMKNLVLMTCVISALVASVVSVKCLACCSENSTTCNNVTEIECLGDYCMTCSQWFFNGNKEYNGILKGCPDAEMCENEGRTGGENLKFRFYTSCCKGDYCNRDQYRLPVDDRTPNGVQCDTCYSLNSTEECVSTKKINCTGNENQCFTYMGTMKNPDGSVVNYSLKGCANNYTCRYNVERHIGVTFLYGKGMNCYIPHNPPVPPKYTNGS
ncbi:hypothetical protein GDO81_003108 [Engystomops pustulosus]|uniref:UPAR/Ly6 domain-containing protein n=1 Tax=Engystomops pustulosus TaxID=76066 RepID=A0AAV6ZZZ2_ENGPU|nr:hypothetical protein GDO81_003108 [Engystomops pustulosus]